ncbi:hypothetical protein APHAL10511_006268 [Amanita phalloides]|nr:hypothetical protein APHAL10511_006268 [Amanita phalloides]
MSEIDQIFATKGKALDPPPSNKKEKKRALDVSGHGHSSEHKKRPLPETVIDIVQPKRPKIARATKSRSNRSDYQDDDQTKFKDSRGLTTRRTTEEGWPIYKEDELGISDGGGGKSTALWLKFIL